MVGPGVGVAAVNSDVADLDGREAAARIPRKIVLDQVQPEFVAQLGSGEPGPLEGRGGRLGVVRGCAVIGIVGNVAAGGGDPYSSVSLETGEVDPKAEPVFGIRVPIQATEEDITVGFVVVVIFAAQ